MLDDITTPLVFTYFLVFCRIGTGIMLLPGLAESYISPQARLLAALVITGLVTPVIKTILPALPATVTGLFLLIAGEIVIGMFIGTIARIIISALHVAGTVIANQTGLAAATMFDPTQKEQSTIIGAFLTLLAILLIFTTDLHHLFLKGLADSYTLFAPGDYVPVAGFAETVGKTLSSAFMVGIKISAPQIIVGLLLYLASGVMGRLMPQMQVFFVIMPLQIGIGFFILMVTMSATMMWFINYYAETMGMFGTQ